MKITEHRTKEILNRLDDKAADHTLLFEEMTLFRDAVSLVRQLQAAEQAAWHAGLDEGRAQEDHGHPPTSAPVGVAEAWQQGYHQGILDERISEANIGIAGFAAKVEPARTNPYLAQQPATDGYCVTREDGECVSSDPRCMHNKPAAVDEALRAEIERLCACLKRANDQAEHFEREWYLRGDALEELQKVCELHRVDGEYAHRLAVMLECALLDKTGCWNEAHRTLDEYRAAVHAIDPPLPTFMGEPIGRSDLQPNT